MASVVSREAYFETGLDVLSDLGYGGLKLAEVCNRLGVTTGSFYHYFTNWPAYTKDLVDYWVQERTVQMVEAVRSEPDPRRRIDILVYEGLRLPHGAEAAIRVWSSVDPQVHAIQAAVDQQRFDIVYESAHEILQNTRRAEVFARWAVYLLVGYEQSTLPHDTVALQWIAERLGVALDTDGFASVPGSD
ncbi:TetR family transcriptional regulator [Mycolicibacterium moriokaense]|jgi:AcrR family transcriptional regulator|uniref:Transcriptional regulator n=1 Tax=Mycolicibacterium moriokaense TaxID=39691 RepID=A0AAD1H6Z7_9MYCO|nr:TetR/AcrR family transcriptional regulator [Mycolicibacterium moriokaense]MCV7037686.1 TetR/AcrR family transcriptional regulator [Mycolicibacterium moriokaense]ORB23726.1 TetR family transcriptional regulator [Mycolicibacterium moriokaense]BBW99374.1 transcriptional regulator [Mycolicibacterium moriokaense]